MTVLSSYNQFAGRHYETGSVANVLAYQGAQLSEALLLGISGGIAFGYFTFEYEGYRPHLILLPRNTFDPLDTLLDRLAIPREVLQTTSADKAQRNLLDVLENGQPALVWLDKFLLPYMQHPYDERNWRVEPTVVFGVDGDTVSLADRANVPLTVPLDAFMRAWGRVKQERYRLMTLEAPDMTRLPGAVQKGIWQCISLFTDKPPKGKKENFGFAAYDHWGDLLTNTRNKASWTRYFPPGERLYAALAGDVVQPGGYDWITGWSAAPGMERTLYADFLDEAAQLLERPALTEAGGIFRQAADAWLALANLMLPDAVPLLAETRQLKERKRALFTARGMDALGDIADINSQLEALRQQATASFPMSEAKAQTFYAGLAAQVRTIAAVEREAVDAMQAAMAG
jgi:hypothetical protein